MPPRPRKKKAHRSFLLPGTGSEEPSDSDARKAVARQEEGETSSPASQSKEKVQLLRPDEQIKGFVSQQELMKHARAMGIKRVMLADLQQQSDLDNKFVGGQVMGHYSLSYSQGHELSIFIQDESTTQGSQHKHLRVTICEELAEYIPVLRDDAKLFLYKALVKDDSHDFSQDHGKCLNVDKPDAQIWIVHRDVRKPHFFSQASCKKKWWNKTKQKREAMKLEWPLENAGGSHKQSDSTAASLSKPQTGTTYSADGNTDDNQSQTSSFPDNSDFPDSAFKEDTESNAVNSGPSSLMESDSSSSNAEDDSDREWNIRQQHSTATGRGYEYTNLADLRIGEKKKNIIGVVKEFKMPSLTHGSDYYSTLTLMDESDPLVGTKCLIFNKSPPKLPQVKRVGDIVCLHRVNVNSYNYQTQLQGVRYSSSIRFSGNVSKKILPTTGSVTFTCSVVEKQRVRELREWARTQRREEALHALEAVAPDKYFDLVCQIVSLTISKVPRCVVLTVWDGTPHSLHCKNIKLVKKHEEGYPIVKEDPGLSEDSEGYQAHVMVYNKKCISKGAKLLPGQFVYLQNLHSAVVDGEGSSDVLELCMHKEDGALLDMLPPRIEVLDKRDVLYAAQEKRLEQALTAVTTTRHPGVAFSTVDTITSYVQPLPAKFRCRAKLLRVNTPSLEDMVVANCSECGHMAVVSREQEMDISGVAKDPCSVCSRSGNKQVCQSCQFYFKITLGDTSGSMEVDVAHEEAVKLFGDLRPNNFYQYQDMRYRLMEKVYCLTGGNAPFGASGVSKPRPWIDCCVLAVNYDGSVYYCLFDTELNKINDK